MEKIGLFDLIDKFTTSPSREKKFANGEQESNSNEKKQSEINRSPDFGAQPQYVMNAKLQAFLARHDKLKSEIPPRQNSPTNSPTNEHLKRQRKQNAATKSPKPKQNAATKSQKPKENTLSPQKPKVRT